MIVMQSPKYSKLLNLRSNTMNKYRFAAAALFLILATGTCLAQVDMPKTLGNLDVYGIKEFKITSNARDYSMDLIATTTNANSEALKLRKGQFDVIFEGQDGRPLLLGGTSVEEHIMPGKAGKEPGQSDLSMTIGLGPQSQATVQKILQIINIIGNPGANLKISIRGKSEVGMQLPRGWVYEQGKRMEIELVFTPSMQREWVLK
jgi:hypothetical protein